MENFKWDNLIAGKLEANLRANELHTIKVRNLGEQLSI